MTDIVLHTDCSHQVTAVPNIFIDQYIQDANGEFVKIYLFLLRRLGQADCHFSVSEMADRFNFTESDIHRGLAYWEKLQLLQLEYDASSQLTGIRLLEPQAEKNASDTAAPAITSAVPAVTSAAPPDASPAPVTGRHRPRTYSMEELSAFASLHEVGELLYVAERYLNHTLSSNDLNIILYWYDELGFPTDLIEYLIEYCIEKGHSSLYYMNKVALNWAEGNICTVQEAKQSASIHSQAYYVVMKALGITGRNLIEKEISLIEKWTGVYGFSLDIICEACSRTIQNTGKSSFVYADSILTSWHEKGIRHLEDITALDKTHAFSAPKQKAPVTSRVSSGNRFHNFNQRQQDDAYYEDLEQKLLRK